MNPSSPLAGRVALVTGASRGIGRAIAVALGRAGASVCVNYLAFDDRADDAVGEIRGAGGTAWARAADVRDPSQVDALVGDVLHRAHRLDILVTAAGVAPDGLFLSLPDAEWRRAIETNLFGTVQCCRAVMPAMLRQGWGRIITVSSLSATRGRPGVTAYAASKGAVEAFTRALAAEVAPKGITVNALQPGWIATDMTAPVLAQAPERVRGAIPMRRPGQPEEVAAAALFLASAEASYITGTTITVAGGAP